jgi:putative oxidoreductase
MTDLLTAANLGLFLLRLGTGVVFIAHGCPKMTGHSTDEKVGRNTLAKSIARLGLPFPSTLAFIVGTTEFFGGLMLILGLETQWSALTLAFIMLVASSRNVLQEGFVGSADFPFSLLVVLLALALLGSGAVSLDQLILAGRLSSAPTVR